MPHSTNHRLWRRRMVSDVTVAPTMPASAFAPSAEMLAAATKESTHASSNTASISTGTPIGNEPMPTALRTPTP